MKKYRSSPKSFKRLALAVIVSGCMFTSSAHAIFLAESHACKNDSKSGGAWIGGYYFPGTRIAVTHQKDERYAQKLFLSSELWAYPEGGGDAVFVKKETVSSPPGLLNNHVAVWFTDPETAPGHLLSVAAAWHPGMTRWSGTYIGGNDFVGGNGCRNQLIYF